LIRTLLIEYDKNMIGNTIITIPIKQKGYARSYYIDIVHRRLQGRKGTTEIRRTTVTQNIAGTYRRQGMFSDIQDMKKTRMKTNYTLHCKERFR